MLKNERSAYIIRHAQSTQNAGAEPTTKFKEIPLTPHGVQQSILLAETYFTENNPLLKPEKVITSDFLRAKETSKPTCEKLQLPSSVDPNVGELDYVDYSILALETLTPENRRALRDQFWENPDPTYRHTERVQSFEDMIQHVDAFLHTLREDTDGAAVFSHGLYMRALLWRTIATDQSPVTSRDKENFWKFCNSFDVPNCALIPMHLDGGGNIYWGSMMRLPKVS